MPESQRPTGLPPMPTSDEHTAVLLIAHGSRHAPANDDLHQLARRLSDRGPYRVVEASFLELAEPGIVAGGDRCVDRGATRVLMVPYLLSAGVHLLRDLTAARDELVLRHPEVEFRLGSALGPHPLLDALVAERARQAELQTTVLPPSTEVAERYAPLERS
jgi:sirohydrochlorin ferrochelatase